MSYRSIMTLLWVLISVMLVAGCLVSLPSESKNALENFIRAYQGILTSIGTLGLVGLLAVITTHISNLSASNRDISDRKVSTELKIVEFRQKWIEDFRNDIAEFISSSGVGLDEVTVSRLQQLHIRIHLRLNPN